VAFCPQTPEAIALLCGCKVSELPVYLQNWYKREPYRGNSILDDVDPLESLHRQNPWGEFPVRVCLVFSKRTMARWKKTGTDHVKMNAPTPEVEAEFDQRCIARERLFDKETGMSYRIRYYTGKGYRAELNHHWRKNRYVSPADVFHYFTWDVAGRV